MPDYYQTLDLPRTASEKQMKEQWLLLLHAWHPDKFKNTLHKSRAQDKTKEINAAYAVLSKPGLRARYNRQYTNGNGHYQNHRASNRAGYSIQGENKAKGKYLDVQLLSLDKNKVMYCDRDCIWYPSPERCLNKTNVALSQVDHNYLTYTEVILNIENIFEYELYISFENSCFLIDLRGNLYKRRYLFCDAFLRDKNRFLHTGEWLGPGTRAQFLLAFPEFSQHALISEISFHQNVFKPGFKFSHLIDKEVYNLTLSNV
ncbi:J domain-containing protein [bacterium]|nr:J domain-containing protein [bacterium]